MKLAAVFGVLVFGFLASLYIPLPGAGPIVAIAFAAGMIVYKLEDVLLLLKKTGTAPDEDEDQNQ